MNVYWLNKQNYLKLGKATSRWGECCSHVNGQQQKNSRWLFCQNSIKFNRMRGFLKMKTNTEISCEHGLISHEARMIKYRQIEYCYLLWSQEVRKQSKKHEVQKRILWKQRLFCCLLNYSENLNRFKSVNTRSVCSQIPANCLFVL